MIKNYLKASLAALWRRKWFSLLTLFSIAISLVVVTCGASFWNMISAPLAPEVHKDRTFYLQIERKEDISKFSGKERMSGVPQSFFSRDIYQLKTPELVTAYSKFSNNEYIRNNKVKVFNQMYTDANFFQVFEFDFVAGKPYNQTNLDEGGIISCVLSEDFASYYFGDNDCIGQFIEEGTVQFKVVGIVRKPATLSALESDIYRLCSKEKIASLIPTVAFLCPSPKAQPSLDIEIKHASDFGDQAQIYFKSTTSISNYLTTMFNFSWDDLRIYVVLILIAMIIPALCLIDILKNNQSHRIEELAIRRAFGARRKNIVALLLVDNLLITTIGGLFGLAFSFLFFAVLSDYSWLDLFFVFFDWRAFLYYIAVFLLIGGIAGIFPARRLSKQPIVNALNFQEYD